MITIIIYDPIEGKLTMTIPSEKNLVFEIREGKLTVRERSYNIDHLRHELNKVLSWIK